VRIPVRCVLRDYWPNSARFDLIITFSDTHPVRQFDCDNALVSYTRGKEKCSHENDIENKKVFSFRQNDVSDTQSVMSCGRLFQSVGPAVANARSPIYDDERADP